MRAAFRALFIFAVIGFVAPKPYGGQTSSDLTPWAQDHMTEVREMANKLRNEYNIQASGRSSVPDFVGKTQTEIDAIARGMTEELISDMRSGRISYSDITKPNYFENQAALKLESMNANSQMFQNLYDNPDALKQFDEISHYTYPPEVKVINGKTYITQKNCTTATASNLNPSNPFYSYFQRNLSAQQTSPLFANPASNQQMTSSSYFDRHFESFVPNYSPEVSVDQSVMERLERQRQANAVMPKDDAEYIDQGQRAVYVGPNGPDYSFDSETDLQRNNFPTYIQPGSTSHVTVKKYNKTIITGPNGVPITSGSESESRWDNGQLVYDFYQPFGNNSYSLEESWKHQERERLYWLFQQNSVSKEELARWQHQQEQRLHDLAYRYNTTIEDVKEWQRKELDRYKVLTNQYSTTSTEQTEWQKQERGRLNWLIHQNSVTKEELEKWQNENQGRLYDMAQKYQISYDELKQWQRTELDRLYEIFNKQNTEIENLKIWQKQEREHLNSVIQQHNFTVDQLQTTIQREQNRLADLSKQYHVNVDSMEKWFKSELARLTEIINTQQEEMRRMTDWQRSERDRLEMIVRQHNLTVEELNSQMQRDRNTLFDLSQKYHISIQELEEWQRREISRLKEIGSRNLEQELKDWQVQERERLMNVIRKNDLTIEEFEKKITDDRSRLQMLAGHYQVQVEEIEEWLKKEVTRLQAEGLIKKVEKDLTDWQIRERDRLMGIVRQNELTIEELESKIRNDHSRLTDLANHYHIRVEEVEDWLKKEVHRLQGEGLVKVDDLKEWQKNEREKLLQIVQQNEVTVEEFQQKLKTDKDRLQQMAWQYHVEVEEIEDWIKKEGDRLQVMGLIKQTHENFNDWQTEEHKRLLSLIKQNEFTIDQLQQQVVKDRQHIDDLSYVYNVRSEDIYEWLKLELNRLNNQGLLKMEQLQDWQYRERERLQQVVLQNQYTIEEYEKRLKEDRNRLQQLAYQYHVTTEEIEKWITHEGNRFITLGLVKPASLIKEEMSEWQIQERNQLQNWAQSSYMTLEDFETRLKNDRYRLERLAWQYHVTVEEIEEFIKKEAQRLQNMNMIHHEQQMSQLTQWQQSQREYIQQLIQMHKWSVEELDRKLKHENKRLEQLAQQYHITLEELERWYSTELDRLLRNNQIYTERLTNWQEQEKARLYYIISQQKTSIQQLERMLWQDQENLRRLADTYRVTIEELKVWQEKEIGRLYNLGLVSDLRKGELQQWQKDESARLRLIAKEFTISYIEIMEFLYHDRRYHEEQLIGKYGVSMQDLESWQKIVVDNMNAEGLLDRQPLKTIPDWQKRERERIYLLIQSRYDGSKNLKEWQQSNDLRSIAAQYRITEQTLKNWQIEEMQRLIAIARYYKVSLSELAEFRNKELLRLQTFAHSVTMSKMDYDSWFAQEKFRLDELAKRHSQSLLTLVEWRRHLFLLCQGLIDFNEGNVGQEIGSRGSYTARRNQSINVNRGDQPPQIFDEDDYYEEVDIDPNPDRGDLWNPTTSKPIRPIGPVPIVQPPRPVQIPSGGYTESHKVYRKKEMTYTVPVGYVSVPAASATAHSYGSGGSYAHANVNVPLEGGSDVEPFEKMSIGNMQKRSMDEFQESQKEQKLENFEEGQQLVQEQQYLGNLEDFSEGQQIVQSETNLGNLFENGKDNLRQEQTRTNGHHYPGLLESSSSHHEKEEHRHRHHHGENLTSQKENGQQALQEQQFSGRLEDFSENRKDNNFGGQQVVQEQQFSGRLEDFSNDHKDNLYGGQQVLQEQQYLGKYEDFGGQQLVQQEESLGRLEDYGQQVQQKELHFGTYSEKQVDATKSESSTISPTDTVEVKAEEVKEGWWSKVKSKTKDFFG
ncbi:hypothetical protein ACFFRR_004906 [Megaselia abdita]